VRSRRTRAGIAALAVGPCLLVAGATMAPAGAAQPTPPPISDYADYPQPELIPEGCVAEGNLGSAPDVVVGTQYTVTGGPASGTYASLAQIPATLTSGDVVTMTWASFAPGCEEAGIGLAVKESDAPTFEPSSLQRLLAEPAHYDYCGPGGVACEPGADGRYGPLTVTVPDRTVTCMYQLDATLGPPLEVVGPLPRGTFYSSNVRGDDGPTMLISAYNGGFPCPATLTVDKQWVIDGVLGDTPPADLPEGFTITVVSRSNLGAELGRAVSSDGGESFDYTNASGATGALDIALDGRIEVLEDPPLPGGSVTSTTTCEGQTCTAALVNTVGTTTTTTSPPTTAPTTTTLPATTTTVAVLPTTIVNPSTTVAPVTPTPTTTPVSVLPTTARPSGAGTLPRTGGGASQVLVLLGAGSIVAGLGALLLARRGRAA